MGLPDAVRSGQPLVLTCLLLIMRRFFAQTCARLTLSVTLVCLWSSGSFAQAPPAPPPPDTKAQDVARFEGQPVAEIRVVADGGVIISQNPGDLPQRAGEPYDSETVRGSLRQLYATG